MELNTTLSKTYAHERDANIKFYEQGHRYEVLTDIKSRYTSVTTFCKSHFPKFDADTVIKSIMNGKNWGPDNKYWGMTTDKIKKSWNNNGASVSEAGTNLHYEIECFMNNDEIKWQYNHQDLLSYYNDNKNDKKTTVEWEYFLKFIEENSQLKPYRTEWIIYDDDIKIAGSIDMVYINDDGTLTICDWKRCKEISPSNNYGKYALTPCISHMPDTNFWHYALQLNTYKMILEKKYGYKVRDLYLLRLHPDAEEKTYEKISLPILKAEMAELRSLRMKNSIKKA